MQRNLLTESEQIPDSNQRLTGLPIRHSFRDGEIAAVSRAELPIRAFFAALVACGQQPWPRR
jgi:hypothetical protein